MSENYMSSVSHIIMFGVPLRHSGGYTMDTTLSVVLNISIMITIRTSQGHSRGRRTLISDGGRSTFHWSVIVFGRCRL